MEILWTFRDSQSNEDAFEFQYTLIDKRLFDFQILIEKKEGGVFEVEFTGENQIVKYNDGDKIRICVKPREGRGEKCYNLDSQRISVIDGVIARKDIMYYEKDFKKYLYEEYKKIKGKTQQKSGEVRRESIAYIENDELRLRKSLEKALCQLGNKDGCINDAAWHEIKRLHSRCKDGKCHVQS